MNLKFLSLLSVVLLLFSVAAAAAASESQNEQKLVPAEILLGMTERIQENQWQDSKPFDIFDPTGHDKGTYKSNIHMNLAGGNIMALARRSVPISDNNRFVTNIVLDNLFESNKHATSKAVPINDSSVAMALDAMMMCKNKNFPENCRALFGFWPQVKTKLVAGEYWQQWSKNLSPIGKDGTFLDQIIKALLEKLHLEWIYDLIFSTIQQMLDIIIYSFNLPSDADDTSNYLAFVFSHLLSSPLVSQSTKDIWLKNPAAKQVSDSYRYIFEYTTYCPASKKIDRNVVDPRTWAVYKDFFLTLNYEDECLITTWLQNSSGYPDFWKNKSAQSVAPFNVNNVDVSVAANGLYGVATSFVGGGAELQQEFLQYFVEGGSAARALTTTAKLIAWVMKEQNAGPSSAVNRKDFATPYYPSWAQANFFFARLSRFLEVNYKSFENFPAMREVSYLITNGARTGVTQFVLDSASPDFNCSSEVFPGAQGTKRYKCWESFLGLADTPTKHYDDRFFTTSLNLNALIDLWTEPEKIGQNSSGSSSKIVWKSDASERIIRTVFEGISFLVDFYSSAPPAYSFSGAFFSGSVHCAPGGSPFAVPINFIKYYPNNTNYVCGKNASDTDNFPFSQDAAVVFGVEGKFTNEAWNKMDKLGNCVGVPFANLTATSSEYLNCGAMPSPWPFWSSEGLTLSFALRALSKFRAIVPY